MGTKAGQCGTGALHYGDELSVLAGLLLDSPDVVYPDDSPTEHDSADIPELDDAA